MENPYRYGKFESPHGKLKFAPVTAPVAEERSVDGKSQPDQQVAKALRSAISPTVPLPAHLRYPPELSPTTATPPAPPPCGSLPAQLAASRLPSTPRAPARSWRLRGRLSLEPLGRPGGRVRQSPARCSGGSSWAACAAAVQVRADRQPDRVGQADGQSERDWQAERHGQTDTHKYKDTHRHTQNT